MAIVSPKFVDYHTKTLTGSTTESSTSANAIEWSLDARRARIFFRRANSGDLIRDRSEPNVPRNTTQEQALNDLKSKQGRLDALENNDGSLTHKYIKGGGNRLILTDYVAIIDIDRDGIDKGTEEIVLPFIPKELNYQVDSSFVAIKPIGANNPRYQFTGSEDHLEFEIDWHSFDESREDVIRNCRKIEALSKADGYNRPPHRVMLKWGEDDKLFDQMIFVVTAAPYRMTQFSKGHIDQSGSLRRTSMLPIQAYQKVKLSRITSKNLTTKEVQYVKV